MPWCPHGWRRRTPALGVAMETGDGAARGCRQSCKLPPSPQGTSKPPASPAPGPARSLGTPSPLRPPQGRCSLPSHPAPVLAAEGPWGPCALTPGARGLRGPGRGAQRQIWQGSVKPRANEALRGHHRRPRRAAPLLHRPHGTLFPTGKGGCRQGCSTRDGAAFQIAVRPVTQPAFHAMAARRAALAAFLLLHPKALEHRLRCLPKPKGPTSALLPLSGKLVI